MNDTYDLTTYSASKLAELIRNNVVSSEEVVKSHISRIKEVNPKLNEVVEETDDTQPQTTVKKELSELAFLMSSMNNPFPVSSRASSNRFSGCPK